MSIYMAYHILIAINFIDLFESNFGRIKRPRLHFTTRYNANLALSTTKSFWFVQIQAKRMVFRLSRLSGLHPGNAM
jgi:hypothetical protein